MNSFVVVHTFELYQNNNEKIKFSKLSQVWSCFEDLDVRNTWCNRNNLDIHSGIYRFVSNLASNLFARSDVIILSFLHTCMCSCVSHVNSQIYWALKQPTTLGVPFSGDGPTIAFSNICTPVALQIQVSQRWMTLHDDVLMPTLFVF